MDIATLKLLIEEDHWGLLKVKPKSSTISSDDRLLKSFQEINAFHREHGRPPKQNKDNINEITLYKRLKHIKSDNKKVDFLIKHDEFYLLDLHKIPLSIDDVLADDPFNLLSDKSIDIFTIKHLPKFIYKPEYIAQRIPCKNFDSFEELFRKCHIELKLEKRKIRPFAKAQQIAVGNFFVLKGILLFVAEIIKLETTSDGRSNPRLRCIFENGTEGDLLLRSLAAELYKDGRRVTDVMENQILNTIKTEDKETGYIYVVKSQSAIPEIRSKENLYKIGFSRDHPKARLQRTETEPTFLYASISIIKLYRCFNLNPQKLELLLHTFFADACLDLVITDSTKKQSSPREWFIVPLHIIDEAIELLISGEITNYCYCLEREVIIGK